MATGPQPGSKSSRHELGSESSCVSQWIAEHPLPTQTVSVTDPPVVFRRVFQKLQVIEPLLQQKAMRVSNPGFQYKKAGLGGH